VEAVIIATPIKTHYNIVREALLHGKHVFVEKPITDDPEQAMELLELSERLGLNIFVDYILTFSRSVQEAVQISKSFGDLEYMELYSAKMDTRGIDVYWALGSHLLSIVDLFLPLKSACFFKSDRLYCKGKCSVGSIRTLDDRVNIFVSLINPSRVVGFTCYFKYGFIACKLDGTYPNVHAYSMDNDNKILYEYFVKCNEEDNIDISLDYFSKMLEGAYKSNIDMAVEVTKIIKGFEK
jgi:hypothetical protein